MLRVAGVRKVLHGMERVWSGNEEPSLRRQKAIRFVQEIVHLLVGKVFDQFEHGDDVEGSSNFVDAVEVVRRRVVNVQAGIHTRKFGPFERPPKCPVVRADIQDLERFCATEQGQVLL